MCGIQFRSYNVSGRSRGGRVEWKGVPGMSVDVVRVEAATHLGELTRTSNRVVVVVVAVFNGVYFPCIKFSRIRTEHVHVGAQAHEPARTEEERSSVGVCWKFVAGLFGDRAERSQLFGKTGHVPTESDQSCIRGIYRQRGRVRAAD